jgi:hypothetical protein
MTRETKILTNPYNREVVILAITYFQNFCFVKELLKHCSFDQLEILEISSNGPSNSAHRHSGAGLKNSRPQDFLLLRAVANEHIIRAFIPRGISTDGRKYC